MKKRLLIPCLVSLALLVASSALAQAVVGSAAPAFTLPDTQGATHRLSDFAGKVVVLEWINPDCPFVKKHYEPKNMQTLQARYTGQGVVWLSICSSAAGKQGHYSAAEWNAILADQGSAATALLLDPDGQAGLAYGAKTTPHLFVIDSAGVLVYDGAIDDKPSTNSADIPGARSYLSEAVEAVLAGATVPLAKTTPYGCSVKY
jgi:peroxiredoxin